MQKTRENRLQEKQSDVREVIQAGTLPYSFSDGWMFSVEAMRAFAICFVVGVHICGPLFEVKSSWWTACIFDSAGRICVPLFVMISGLLLLDPKRIERESTWDFMRGRIAKIVVPFAFWSAVYLGFRACNGESFAAANWGRIASSPAYFHLEFVYHLLGLYLATPILRRFLAAAPRSEIVYFIALWLVGSSIYPLIQKFAGGAPPIVFVIATNYAGYYVLGYALKDIRLDKVSRLWAIAALCTCVALTAIATALVTDANAATVIDETFFVCTTPLVAAMATLWFLLFQSINTEPSSGTAKHLKAAIKSLSAASFTIYLIHPLVILQVVHHLNWIQNQPTMRSFNSAAFLCLATVITLVTCWLFRAICRAIRIPRCLVP